jgi:CRAL/TRIO domain
MDKICPKCAADPTSHSFKKISEKGGIVTFYSQPSKAKLYDDLEGIINHVDNMMASIGNKPWTCIVDGDGFDLKHAAEIKIGNALFKILLSKYAATFQGMKVINPTWHIQGMIKLASLAMKPEMFAKVKILEDRKYSVLEFI